MPHSLAPFGLPARYRLEGGIAAGGMAAVYAAHDTLLNRPVAVKVLAEHLNDDPSARQRFQREARAAAGLSAHASVVTIFDVGEHDGRSFIVMERRDGGTVGEELARRGRIHAPRALAWLRDTADALDAAHEAGIVHRDIKPGNLLLDDRDKVAVADFGIASVAHETERFTQTGQVLGTAAYISPEQAAGEPATSASDRYALAVLAYELLCGEKPFRGSHFAAQARAHIQDAPPRAPGLPPAAQDVIVRGMAKDPGERWPTAGAFATALTAALEGAGAVTADTEATRALPPEPSGRTPRERPRQRPRQRLGSVLAGVAALVVVAAAVAIAVSGSGDGTSRSQTSAKAPTRHHAQRTPTPAATAETTATATATATATVTTEPATSSASSLQAKGFALMQSGDYAAAIPILQSAVDACGSSGPVDPCAYATYNLGASLNRSGRPAQAIGVLQRELARWPSNQPGTVNRELQDACHNAGQSCGGAPAPKPGKGHDKLKGQAQGHQGRRD